jgi:hypothetical protein
MCQLFHPEPEYWHHAYLGTNVANIKSVSWRHGQSQLTDLGKVLVITGG